MLDKIFDRKNVVVLIIFIALSALLFRLADLTIIQGEYYREKADDSFLKRMTLSAKRGEIYDTNGNLLAGNIPSYTVQILDAPQYAKEVDKVSVELLNLLEERGESYLTFPIQYNDGVFQYTNDIAVTDWLEQNGFSENTSAEEVYRVVREDHYIDESLDNYTAQTLLLYKGVRLPISVRSMKFLNEIYKENFLDTYKIDFKLTAEEAFYKLRDHNSFSIDEGFNESDALKAMTVRHALNLSGYYSYIPSDISTNISKETAVIIQERKLDFPGVSIIVEPIRDYPYSSSAAHVIGYMGKISSDWEVQNYVKDNGYNANDLIGKTGLENSFEDLLHGEDGYQFVYADAKGNYIGDFIEGVEGKESKPSFSGKNIELTIDINLQQKVEEYLAYTLKQLQAGEPYESPYGDMKFDQFSNAQTGAAIVVKVDTGEILALVSHPSYDLNLFSTGISTEDWDSLQPENSRNPYAPRPLYNLATNTSVQPGSTFKMVTVLAALEQGLDPTDKLYSNGVVEVGNHLFRCWYYQAPYHGIHGSINAMEALMVSCNYFMFDIVRGYDYYRNRPLDFEMDTDILLDYSKLLGLGEESGVEIYEDNRGLPSEELKKYSQKYSLKRFLNVHVHEYFSETDLADDRYKEELVNTIVSWADEYVSVGMSRNEITRRLMDLGPITTYSETELLTDYILYSYFKQIPWREGDDLNLSIGQGDHRYTVLQMARMIATIANDGYLNDLTLVKSVDGEIKLNPATEQIEMNDLENLYYVREGMYKVAHERRGSAYQTFNNFPIKVGGKTGTGENSGRIPPVDEVEYLREYLGDIVTVINGRVPESSEDYVNIGAQDLENLTNAILEERNLEIAILQQKYLALPEGIEKDELAEDIEKKANSDYLELGSVMRVALKELGNGLVTDEIINEYREMYDPFAWFVSFAPFDDPEIAVVIMIPQGGHGYYGAPMVRDIYQEYFGVPIPVTEE